MKPMIIWLFGLSGAGKSTISNALTDVLQQQGVKVCQLDGDHLRKGLNSNLGFSHEDRLENIRRSAEVAKLFAEAGMVTICSFITPTEATRRIMREVLSDCQLLQVFVKASIDTCRKRDPKGFYKKVDRGEIKNFTGIDSLFEEPAVVDLVTDTDVLSVDEAAQYIVNVMN